MSLYGRSSAPARGPRSVSDLALKSEIVLRAGPGLDILVACRAGSGPHNSICGPDPGMHNCCGPGPGLDLKSYLRAVPGPIFQ